MGLETMTADEADAYLEVCLARYAVEIARAAGWSEAEGQSKARAQFQEILPRGGRTPQHAFLHVIDDAGERVGVVWCHPMRERDPPRLHLYEIHLRPEARGRGLGTQAMRWLEHEARRHGLGAVGLSVAHHNQGAVRLYERLGYEAEFTDERGMAMLKRLEAD